MRCLPATIGLRQTSRVKRRGRFHFVDSAGLYNGRQIDAAGRRRSNDGASILTTPSARPASPLAGFFHLPNRFNSVSASFCISTRPVVFSDHRGSGAGLSFKLRREEIGFCLD